MAAVGTDRDFTGSVPEFYETYMVPMIFAPYAADLSARVAKRVPKRVLEIAAGTGVVTRAMAAALPEGVAIVATDLNQSMLTQAAKIGTRRPVQWRQADAQALPFDTGSFDAVVCQFGVMFFPDRPKAFAEARRVLRTEGVFFFSVWDRIGENEFADTVTNALAALFPQDPPAFMARTPHGYHEAGAIRRDLAAGGWTAAPEFVTLTARSRAPSAQAAAFAYCQGTPLRGEIEARGPARLEEATQATAAALTRRFGTGEIAGKIQAHIVTVKA